MTNLGSAADTNFAGERDGAGQRRIVSAARSEFDRISQMARDTVSALYETVWAVNPRTTISPAWETIFAR